jgi:transposase-like protein
MKVKRHSAEQIICKLRTAEQLLNQAQAVADVCRALEVSPATYHRWQQLYGGMETQSAGGHELVRPNASRSWNRRTAG